MTQLFKDIQVTKRVYDFEAIKKKVDKYLGENPIDGDTYKVDRVTGGIDGITIELERVGEFPIDEDFPEDDKWESFCDSMKVDLGVRFVSVPSRYYAK